MMEDFSCTFRKRNAFNQMPDLHSHAFYEMYYLVSGERRYFIQDTVFTVHAKGFVFIKPGLLHKTSFSGESMHTRYFASIPQEWFESVASILPPFFLSKNLPDLEYSFSLLQREAENADEMSGLMCQAIAMEILSHAFRSYKLKEEEKDDVVKKATAFIKKNIEGGLSLESIASEVGMSSTYFSSLFHKKTGMKLSDFIRSARISIAADVLRKGGRVSEASDRAGFSDPAYFKDVFRSVMKISPSSYRRNFIVKNNQ